MNHARTRRITAEPQRPATSRWPLHSAILLACGAATLAALDALPAPAFAAVPREAPILPTVHPTLTPTSAIPVSLIIRGDHTSVWKADLEQRMLVTGNVRIDIGYRSLRADNAAIWLTPSREAGEATWDVAIYLSGNVHVYEGGRSSATATTGNELLVTTRLSRSIQLINAPTSKAEESNPIFRRGDQLRQDLLNRPAQPIHIPQITITSTEDALQSGWIARGPDNRIVAGPGDFQLAARGPNGRIIAVPPNAPKPAKPRPELLIVVPPDVTVRAREIGNEMIAVIPDPYMIYDALDGKPAMEFHAQRMVTFSPADKTPGAATAPADTTTPFGGINGKNISRRITGVYMEGDVTINAGAAMTVHATRLYYDFTSQRAIMLDATLYQVDDKRNIPIYLRASEIRQLARGEYAAKDGNFSTSEFHTPHYNIGASNVYLQDITPREANGVAATDQHSYAFKAQSATIDVQGIPIFYWPYLAGDTSNDDIPLRRIRIGNSKTYGLSLETDWNLFSLAGQVQPKNFHADLALDYYAKRGPAGGVDATWKGEDYSGLFRSYALEDRGSDRLGAISDNVDVLTDERGRVLGRHQQDLGDGWTLNLEGSYISDPNFLQEFFNSEFSSDKEHETSFYLKHQDDDSAISLLGKFNFLDFTTVADQIDDEFTTEKRPEAKYWRLGDSFLDLFTYYSESGVANVDMKFTDFTPQQLGLLPSFLGPPASVLAGPPTATAKNPNATPLTFRQAYLAQGWTTNEVLRGDTRQELDMPLSIGDLKIAPYVTGRVTAWDDAFPESESGNTTRIWGSTGVRSSMEFWRVYSDVDSTFWNIHQLRHVIEPQFNAFATGSDQDRNDLQPFDRDVEGISRASGLSIELNQKWQTKRGGPGHWRNVDWVTLNVQWNRFFDRDQAHDGLNSTLFFPQSPLRGFYFASRPELSLVENSVAADGIWRIGERTRFIGEANYNTDTDRLEQFAAGIAVDQTSALSYFFGNRYVRALDTDEWTIAADYQLTRKYEMIASESYDFGISKDILSSLTIVRKLPRFNTAITVVYDADNADTTVEFSAWPEGLPGFGLGNNQTGGR